MPHQFIKLDDDILTLDNAQEIDDAVDALKRSGRPSVEIYAGGPDEERSTDLVLTLRGIESATHECDDCPTIGKCPYDPRCSEEEADASRCNLVAVLHTLLDPEADDDDRAVALEEMQGALGRFEVSTFEDAGILSGNKGLVLTAGFAQFQITIVRSR